MIGKLKVAMSILALYITIVGIITFSLFILEEAFQTVMFGTWPAKDAKQWALVKKGSNLMEGINNTSRIVNNCFGWIQPFAFLSYRAYQKSATYYIESLRAQVFVNAPDIFVGEIVAFEFKPTTQRRMANGNYLTTSGLIGLISKEAFPLAPLWVKGKLETFENFYVVIVDNEIQLPRSRVPSKTM